MATIRCAGGTKNLDDARAATWTAFFKDNNGLVGLSIDGLSAMHDACRVNRKGEGSFDAVSRAWNRRRKHQIAVHILCATNAVHRPAVYCVFRSGPQAE